LNYQNVRRDEELAEKSNSRNEFVDVLAFEEGNEAFEVLFVIDQVVSHHGAVSL
jgi:hypothetical protein